MTKFSTSFGLGFASAVFLGATLLFVLKPAQAGEQSLGDWVRMSPDAKLAHARQASAHAGGVAMEQARALLYCLHDRAVPAGGQIDVALNEAVRACQDGVRNRQG